MVRAFDTVLGKWFEAATAELLTALMNHPKFFNWRVQRQARMLHDARRLAWGPYFRRLAENKRARRNYRRRWLAHQGAYTYSYREPKVA